MYNFVASISVKLQKCISYLFQLHIMNSGKVWQVESLANLANCLQFVKLKPSKLVVIINNPLADLLIHQTFCQMLEKNKFIKNSPCQTFPLYCILFLCWHNTGCYIYLKNLCLHINELRIHTKLFCIYLVPCIAYRLHVLLSNKLSVFRSTMVYS